MFGRYNQNGTGSYVEDPLERGLGLRCLGICFAIFTLCASFGIGNMVKPILLQMHFMIPFKYQSGSQEPYSPS